MNYYDSDYMAGAHPGLKNLQLGLYRLVYNQRID